MSSKVLIVEDEIFIAMGVENVIRDAGHDPIGIAADSRAAMDLSRDAEIALVDLNLRDGATGIEVGRQLVARGITVMFMTANPDQLGTGVPGAVGVLPKPANDSELAAAVRFVAAIQGRDRASQVRPPRRLKLFPLPPLAPLAAQPAG